MPRRSLLSHRARVRRREALEAALRKQAQPRASSGAHEPRLAAFADYLRGVGTAAGVAMTPARSLQISSVWASTRILSEAIGSLPLILYRRLPNGGRERATDHPLYHVVKTRPNPRLTSAEFRSLLQTDLETYGNALALRVTVRDRTELWPVPWSSVEVRRESATRLVYRVSEGDGRRRDHSEDRVVHLRGPGGDGVCGLSIVSQFRELFGTAWAIEQYVARSFRGGARLAGFLTVKDLTQSNYQQIREWVEEEMEKDQDQDLPFFPGEVDFKQVSQNHEQAEVVSLRDKVDAAIARVYSVPLHKLASHIAQPRANMEQQAREFVDDALRSRAVRWEQRLDADLLREDERGTYYFEFLMDALLRGDAATRAQVNATYLTHGVVSPNEVRQRENMNPVKGLGVHRAPMNAEPIGGEDRPGGSDDEPDAAAAFVNGVLERARLPALNGAA